MAEILIQRSLGHSEDNTVIPEAWDVYLFLTLSQKTLPTLKCCIHDFFLSKFEITGDNALLSLDLQGGLLESLIYEP